MGSPFASSGLDFPSLLQIEVTEPYGLNRSLEVSVAVEDPSTQMSAEAKFTSTEAARRYLEVQFPERLGEFDLAMSNLTGKGPTPSLTSLEIELGKIHVENYSNGGETTVRAKRGGVESDTDRVKPEDRAITKDSNNNRPEKLRIGGPGQEPAPETLDPESPAPPKSISAPSDVADWFGFQVSQYERATASWRVPMEWGLRLYFPLMNPFEQVRNIRSLVDTLRIGQGAAQGTVRGALEDVNRALAVMPQTRGLSRAVGTLQSVTTVTGAVESVVSGQDAGQGGGAAVLTVAALVVGALAKKRHFAKEVAQEYKKVFKQVERENPDWHRANISTEAHRRVQNTMSKRYGGVVEPEPKLGVTHFGMGPKPRFNEGARGDIARLDTNQLIEMKARVKLTKNDQIEVTKKVDGEWGTSYTNQLKSLETNAKATGQQTYIVDATGKAYEYNPRTDKWKEVR